MMNPLTPTSDMFMENVEVGTTSILDPQNAASLYQGEWLQEGSDGTWDRNGTTNPTARCKQVWTQRGTPGSQALGSVAVIMRHGGYKMETDQFEGTFAVGDLFTIHAITVDGDTRCGIIAVAGTEPVYGRVIAPLPANNDGKLTCEVYANPYVT